MTGVSKILIMLSFQRVIIPLSLCLAGFFASCDRSSYKEIDILHIDGVQWACNITSSYGTFGSSYEIEGQNELTLAASKGDLLYMLWEDEEFYYRYKPSDGQNLNFLFDTVDMISVYLNDQLNYLELTDGSLPAKFSDLSSLEMSQLSTLYLDASLINDLIPILEEYDSQIQGMGLVLVNESGSDELSKLLSLCHPEFMVLEDPDQLPTPSSEYAMEGLELLWIQEYSSILAKAAQCCGDLQSLILSGWEAKDGELLPLSSMKNLQNLTLAESYLISLDNIEFPESLYSLNLISCTNLENLDQIQNLPKLCRLNLSGSENVKLTDKLKELESLRWMGFPLHISQKEFQDLTQELNHLEVAEIIGCSAIVDLFPLQALEKLHILTLDLEEEQLNGLDSLQQLDLLIVSEDLFDDNPNYISDLRSSLTDTKVVPGSGLCLGSGWLLLLLPLILTFRFVLRRKDPSSVG